MPRGQSRAERLLDARRREIEKVADNCEWSCGYDAVRARAARAKAEERRAAGFSFEVCRHYEDDAYRYDQLAEQAAGTALDLRRLLERWDAPEVYRADHSVTWEERQALIQEKVAQALVAYEALELERARSRAQSATPEASS